MKKRAGALSLIAAFVLLMRWVDLIWQTRPSLRYAKGGLGLSWIYFATPVGIGGLWFFLFVRELGKRPLAAGERSVSLPQAMGSQ